MAESDTALRGVLDRLEWRCIGPHRGGRVVTVAGDPRDPQTYYFGAVAGGVWKTTDGAQTWQNVSDGFFATAAVGAIAVAASDPNVLYAGTGEATIRGNVSHGDGVYKSTDAGKTWANVGLRDTRHIAKIRVHPQNPDLVYVAAFGHAWGPHEARGVYRSRDGGEGWELVLHKSPRAGAIDLSLDPHNPRILYAAIWQAQRHPHALVSGGEESGLWKSTDGGDTWAELTRKPGLPTGVLGKIGVALSPAQPDRVWALIEADDGAVFRSDDGGETWQRLSEEKYLRTRAWYYMHIIADPQDANTVWVMNFAPWRSIDGGKTFQQVAGPHGDNHDLWIDPQNSSRVIKGNDGGACVSVNGGRSWSSLYNQPTAQLYHVTTDDRFPYRVYGSQQDNTAISVPSATTEGIIHERDWFEPGGGESGYIAIKPDDPDLVVASGPISLRAFNDRMLLYNGRTKQKRNITVWPELHGWSQGAEALKYRFQWTFPILFSRHNPDELYVAGNRLFRSTDLGTTWEVLSPDLTRDDPDKLRASGGPITRDNTGAEVYCTIFSLAESPQQPGRFWAGSDDGLVHRSDDGGRTWAKITPPDLGAPSGSWALINIIEPSPHDADSAYLAATRYKLDDTTPYLYKTTDAGRTWTLITNGIPADEFTRVIRADPARPGLLYAGTETGIYVSFDDGGQWHRLGGNLPVVPIADFVIKNGDLVVATHGRSFWILDDLTPLREVGTRNAERGINPTDEQGVPPTTDTNSAFRVPRSAFLLPPRDTIRFRVPGGFETETEPGQRGYGMSSTAIYSFTERRRGDGTTERILDNAGTNPPNGVIVYFILPEGHDAPLTLRILDAAGQEIRRFTSAEEDKEDKAPKLPTTAGLNRFIWDMRHAGATKVDAPDLETWDPAGGPIALPGPYTVELAAGDARQSHTFALLPDPRITASDADLREQFDLLIAIRDRLSAANGLVNRVRALRKQSDALGDRFAGQEAVQAAAKALKDELATIESALIDTRSKDPRLFIYGLKEKFNGLFDSVDSADYVPPANARQMYDELAARLDEQTAFFEEAISAHGGALNRAVAATGQGIVGG